MNSDGKIRTRSSAAFGCWKICCTIRLAPPPAVPEIDLADPAILKMTLKQRMEDHRSDPA